MPSSSDDVPDKVVKAVARGDEEAVLAWLEGGGRVDATYERGGASGVTLLMSAAHHGHERVVDLLLRRGAEVNLQRSDGWTALMLAARYGHERVVELLIRHGAEVDQQDSIGYTALMAAALFNHPAVVLRLLRAGADTAARSASGNTALKMAKEKGHAECVEAFRQHIATVAGAAKAAAEAAATESAPPLGRWSTMLVGDRASIVGLAGRPALNGRRVRLLSWAGERSRWCAQLEGGGSEQLLIREENLCAVGCSKVECWGCGVMPEPTQSFKCCPICVEQKLATPAYFCSADCQKANWKDHKRWHRAQSDSQAGVRSMYAEDNPQRETSKEEAQAAPFLCKGTDVEEPAQLHARASVAMHKQDYREAAKLCRKAIARNQSSEILLAHSYHLLAVILTRSSDIVGACKSALKAEQLQAQYRGLLASDYTETQLKASIEGWSQTWGMAFSLLRLVDCAALATPPWWNDSDLLRYSEAAILNRPTESEIDIFMSRAIILQGEPRVCRWLCAWAHDHRTAAQLYESARCFRKQAQLIPYMANQLPLDQCAASSERMAAMIAAMPARGASGEEEVLKQMLSKIDLASEVESFGRAFRQGTQVFVHGLQRKPELNGSPGLITGYDEATMRYHLMLTRFQGDTKEVALKEANLKQ